MCRPQINQNEGSTLPFTEFGRLHWAVTCPKRTQIVVRKANTSQAKPMVFAMFKCLFDFSGVWFGFFIVSIQRECPTCLSAFRFSGGLEGQNHEKQQVMAGPCEQ